MEPSPIPFFNQQEEFSNFYSFFQELDTSHFDISNKKLRIFDAYGDNEESNSDPLKEILSTFSFLEDDGKSDQFDCQQSNSLLDFNLEVIKAPQAMNEKVAEADQVRARKVSRQSQNVEIEDSKSGGGQQRRLWVKDRSQAWWDYYNSDDCPDEEFRKTFRMSKATFNMICDELDSAVTKKDTTLRSAIPVRQRVAVCIYRLATGEPLRHVSQLFGLGISTCHKLVIDICAAIKTVLMPKFIQWPEQNKMKEIKNDFQSISGIPNVGGSIYTTHISIIAPKVSAASYFNKRHTQRNQKPSYSTTVQGVVDSKGIFTDVCIGWPGSMSDDKILEKSALFQRANKGLLRDVWVVGNSGYPLMDGVLVPYTHQNHTWSQHSFNEKIDEIQKVAKDAFMKLKGRWTCLQKRTEMKLQDLPFVLGACCVLHNICEMRNEEMDMGLRFDLIDDEMVAEEMVKSVSAMPLRDGIAFNLLHHSHGGSAVR